MLLHLQGTDEAEHCNEARGVSTQHLTPLY